MNLFPQHEVAFPVHHQLLVNPLEFELVVSVVAVAVALDLVSTLDVHILVLVLVHRVSSVVWVLGEIVVVVDPCVIAVSMVAMKTVVTPRCFCSGDSVGGCCCVRSCCLGTTMFGALIGIISSDSHQHLSHFSLCG